MVQTAKVTKLLENGLAEVAVKRQSACGHDCSTCGSGCSALVISPTVAVVAENPVRAQPGDTVTVESGTRRVLGAAALVYLVPFVLFFVGYALGQVFGGGDGYSAGFGVFGFALGLAAAVLLDRHNRKHQGITFHITAIEPIR